MKAFQIIKERIDYQNSKGTKNKHRILFSILIATSLVIVGISIFLGCWYGCKRTLNIKTPEQLQKFIDKNKTIHTNPQDFEFVANTAETDPSKYIFDETKVNNYHNWISNINNVSCNDYLISVFIKLADSLPLLNTGFNLKILKHTAMQSHFIFDQDNNRSEIYLKFTKSNNKNDRAISFKENIRISNNEVKINFNEFLNHGRKFVVVAGTTGENAWTNLSFIDTNRTIITVPSFENANISDFGAWRVAVSSYLILDKTLYPGYKWENKRLINH